MEALAFLKIPGQEALQQAQTALAQAWSFQMDESCQILPLISLTHILDLACAIRKGNSQEMLMKLKNMQVMMDKALHDSEWTTSSDIIAIPINRTPKSSHAVSQDTRMILDVGPDGGDNLMMTFLNKRDAYSITLVKFNRPIQPIAKSSRYLLCGVVLLHKNSSEQKGFKFLQAGLESLEGMVHYRRL